MSTSVEPAVLGWRVWEIHKGELESMTTDEVWRPDRVKVARYEFPTPDVAQVFLTLLVALFTFMFTNAFATAFSQLVSVSSWAVQAAVGLVMAVLLGRAFVRKMPVKALKTLVFMAARVPAVRPGDGTEGLYAFHTRAMLDREFVPDERDRFSGYLMVRGTVYMWGETIDHEYGVKAQYAYPKMLDAVLCFKCHGWLSLALYQDESEPPFHPECARQVEFDDWEPAGVNALREKAPHWFWQLE